MELNGLEQKILSLVGTEKKTSQDKKVSFFIEDQEFIRRLSDHEIQLYLNEECQNKLNSALKNETRASFDGGETEWVTLTYHNEVDIEFIFLYIRYSWKYLRAQSS